MQKVKIPASGSRPGWFGARIVKSAINARPAGLTGPYGESHEKTGNPGSRVEYRPAKAEDWFSGKTV